MPKEEKIAGHTYLVLLHVTDNEGVNYLLVGEKRRGGDPEMSQWVFPALLFQAPFYRHGVRIEMIDTPYRLLVLLNESKGKPFTVWMVDDNKRDVISTTIKTVGNELRYTGSFKVFNTIETFLNKARSNEYA